MVARYNATRLGLSARAQFVACNFGAALGGGFDLIVSNPPYIASDEMRRLSPEVRADPPRALDGGPDGLDGYRVIARQVRSLISSEGHLIVELGLGHAQAVAALFRQAGLSVVAARADLAGIRAPFMRTLPQ
jgi:release factor glutamine methyltransferase